MPRSSSTSVENNFSKGLITEATAMNFPENSVIETDNCVYTKSGKVIRRYGVNYESNYAITSYSTIGVMGSATTPLDYYTGIAITEYEWNTVATNGSLTFTVVQLGDRLTFYSVGNDNSISANRKSFTVNLNTYHVGASATPAGSDIAPIECSFSSGFGYLFVTHPLCEPFYITYVPATDTITTTQISMKTRDFERQADGYENDFRPTASLTDLHKYNLWNQGWYVSARNATPATANVITYWDGARADWPSNADVWWVYKNSNELFDSTLMDTTFLGNTPAPNGHYIYSAFLTTRTTVLGASIPETSAGSVRPSTTAFYAGRVWYAGVNAPGYISKIYFSKIVESTADFGVCYQISDPTSETNADLLPTDGGVIDIPDIARVIRIVAVASSLFVFATNGLWKISGPNGVFAANDYSITKVSGASITGKNSIVLAEGTPMWWDTAGIYAISFDPQSNQETVVNVSETTIQSLINSIPNANLTYVKGVYNNINKTVHWLYRSTTATTVTDNYTYDKLLVLNLTNQSFSTHTFATGIPKVCGLLFTISSNNDTLIEIEGASLVKYLTYGTIGVSAVYGLTVSQFNNSSYLDWYTYNTTGVDYDSEFITGYRVRGELLRKFQANWISVILSNEDNASCFLQGVWDYSNSEADGRFTTTQQIYKQNYARDYSRVKRRIRGSGYSLQFKFSSETGKPFSIVGWTTFESANVAP